VSPLGRHEAGESLPRHRHLEGYVAVVLEGGYEEAGDGGRLRAVPGTVVVHSAYAGHLDRFGAGGARVLNLPAVAKLPPGAGMIADPDAVARLAEHDRQAAAELVQANFRPGAAFADDWPDQLALALRDDPALLLSDWADRMGLDPASVSRGFGRAYGVSPKRFRLEARTHRAVAALPGWDLGIAALAAECGFADQAHLTRAMVALTGTAPARLRAKSVQAGEEASR